MLAFDTSGLEFIGEEVISFGVFAKLASALELQPKSAALVQWNHPRDQRDK